MKKYQSSYVLKQIKKKRIFEKKIHMDFPSNLTPVQINLFSYLVGKINPFSDILGKTKPFFHFQLPFVDHLSILLNCYFCTSFISMCKILSPFLNVGSAQSENRQETIFKEP